MAYTFDTKGVYERINTNPGTLSYTCGTGATLLVVGIVTSGTIVRDDGINGAPTYAGVEMTLVDRVFSTQEGWVELYYLLNPTTGSSETISVPNTFSKFIQFVASSYIASTGASIYDTSASDATTGVNPSVSVTPSGSSSVIVDAMFNGQSVVVTSADRTELYLRDLGSANSGYQYHITTDTSSTAMSYTEATSEDWALIAAVFGEQALTLSVSGPNGGEFYRPNDSIPITWADTGSVADVKLEFSDDNGASWSDIVASTTNDGSYTWTAPVVSSALCLVRISDVLDSGNTDSSDAVFSIFAKAAASTGGGSFVYSWLILVDAIISGAVMNIVEMSNTAIRDYLWAPPHRQITGDFDAKVVKVHDGDTITLQTDFRDFDFPLRLANIDALELNSGGELARDWLKERILNKVVHVKINPENRTGKYGRLIGEVFVDGFNVNDEMMRLFMVVPFGSVKHRIEPFSKLMQKVAIK